MRLNKFTVAKFPKFFCNTQIEKEMTFSRKCKPLLKG